MEQLNCMGDFCPVPALKVNAQFSKLKSGDSLSVILDHSCAVENIREIVKDKVVSFKVNEVANGIWELTLVKR